MGVKILRQRHRFAPTPGACRWCGIPERGHAQQWVPGQRWHGFAPPTPEQVHARMTARFRPQAPSIVTNLASDDRTRVL